MLIHHPLTESHKQAICSWQYEGEYAVYNLPPYETMKAKQSGFMNPTRAENYLGWSEDGELIAYTNFSEKPDGIYLGIGVRPDKCGQGYGQKITQAAARLAEESFPDKPVCLEVRIWNERAIRCYRRAGFEIVTAPYIQNIGAGRGTFYKMSRT